VLHASLGYRLPTTDKRAPTLHQLLTEIAGVDANTGVLLMAASTRPEQLDPALLASRRSSTTALIALNYINAIFAPGN
jgi:ATP-dependent Zn protease